MIEKLDARVKFDPDDPPPYPILLERINAAARLCYAVKQRANRSRQSLDKNMILVRDLPDSIDLID